MQEQSNKQFYISDWHYGHANVIAFDNRPFKSLLEMDEALVDRWNAVVSPGDIVYVLGDMFWCKAQDAIPILRSLKGQKFLIKGNHDRCNDNKFLREFVKVTEYLEVKDSGRTVILCHYPIPCFKNHFYGSFHLYGHVHNSFEWNMMEHDKYLMEELYTTPCQMFNVGAMMPYLTTEYGNAGTLYKFGRAANEAVQKARAQVAALINAEPEQIIFTSGGSEANNLVFRGLKDYLKSIGKTHILVSAVEHDSVLRAAESLIKDGFHVEYIPVSSECRVSPAVIEDALRADTGLVSVMFANNETGAINPIEDIGTICMKRGILFHTDCVQAAGCYPIDVVKIGCDFLSVSSHKIHGCKGIGALYAKDKSKLTPIVYGGSEQEFGLRGGTENVAGIVGFGRACEISSKSLHEDTVWVSTLKQRFFMALNEALKDTGDESCVHVNGMSILTPGKTINLRMDGVDGETLLLMLDGKGVCVSAGSACRSHEAEPSHVLSAMGLSKDEARSSIRISFSKKNTADEAVRAAQILAGCISALRAREEKE